MIDGRRTLGMSICSHLTTERDIEGLAETGERLDAQRRDQAGLPV